MIPPKNAVADHWTWCKGRAVVTGYHWPAKKKHKGEDEGPVFVHRVSRGVVEAVPPRIPQVPPPRPKEAPRPARPTRPKPTQDSLL